MISYLKIIQGSKIYLEEPTQLRLFPSEYDSYSSDDKFYLPIFVEGPLHQGVFKTEVGRVIHRGACVDVIFQTWRFGNRTESIDSVWINEDKGYAYARLASNRFAIAIVNAIMAYSVGIQERLNMRDNLSSKAILLGYIHDHQWLDKLYNEIAELY